MLARLGPPIPRPRPLQRRYNLRRLVVRREGRGLHRLYIDPPRADGGRYVRTVHIFLDPGPSLLDKLHFQFDEVSGSRLREL